ncbi:hypothetical protein N7508_003670 [Penicillium antarcticum]|uniref:uncharacterized protein n=1 Tax=Penicillium antarcticum TaxID=416450 RepID=UPI00239AE43D|nr:uncharacterized protein N7508_003670 [Penicillium antarcticum]KAJ5312840.1 hypothetical protein N7508_003670 [Penicillium antarcticum]
MSTTDRPESGALNPKDDDHPTTSPATDQQPTAPSTDATDSAQTAPANVANLPTPATQPLVPQSGQAAVANHPATNPGTGGETAPVTVTATTGTATTSTSNDTSSAVAQPNPTATTTTSMDTEEPKTVQELSTEQSDDGSSKEVEDAGPSLVITLLLTTGSRHPFTIDGKYLRKRSVNVENSDPFLMSVYTLKELIWREWRSDWETRPSSPSSIRLISFGKLLDDKSPISDSKFSKEHPNVVHMTVKPQEVVDEEDAKGAKAQYNREREASERSPGCRCVIL